jgi:ribosome biogenesis protein Nip4
MRLLRLFLQQVGSSLELTEEKVMRMNNQYFLLNEEMRSSILDKNLLVYAGKYLGKDQRHFVPSSILLEKLGKESSTKKVYVEQDAGWLFVCGKDIFEENIIDVTGKLTLGQYYLVMMKDTCLGYGRYETSANRRVIHNLFDIGDFLRRESS